MDSKEWTTELRRTLEALVHQLSGDATNNQMPQLSRQRDDAETLERTCNTLLMYAAASGGCRLLLVPGRGGVLLRPLCEDIEKVLPMADEVLTRLTGLLKAKAEMSGGIGFIAMRFEGRDYDAFARCIPAKTGERLSVYVVDGMKGRA